MGFIYKDDYQINDRRLSIWELESFLCVFENMWSDMSC